MFKNLEDKEEMQLPRPVFLEISRFLSAEKDLLF